MFEYNGNLVTAFVQVAGLPLPMHRRASDGQLFVEAPMGEEYEIVVENRSRHDRLEVFESVDGQNVGEDEPADPITQRGMVIRRSPWVNKGWRTSNSKVRLFKFSDPQKAVAMMSTGSTENVGVIGIAVFTEKQAYRSAQTKSTDEGLFRGAGDMTLGSPTRGGDMGTGMGREVTDRVGSTTFERATYQPEEVITLRYASREWLIAEGIIRVSQNPDPFPGQRDKKTGYAKY